MILLRVGFVGAAIVRANMCSVLIINLIKHFSFAVRIFIYGLIAAAVVSSLPIDSCVTIHPSRNCSQSGRRRNCHFNRRMLAQIERGAHHLCALHLDLHTALPATNTSKMRSVRP
ncbi:hypothetical protein BKA62DRAFT_708871 [Auriculariales sp. MPI-PUGE-AT-0066]|nr:hypothetical protein BKA62DRAFT_708871 [Auriculariales sp. MPI-PUGE-AT-0066]